MRTRQDVEPFRLDDTDLSAAVLRMWALALAGDAAARPDVKKLASGLLVVLGERERRHMNRTAGLAALLIALSCALPLVPSCLRWLDSQGDHPSAEEVRLIEEKHKVEAWDAEPDPAKREEMRRRHGEINARLVELHRERSRRYDEGR